MAKGKIAHCLVTVLAIVGGIGFWGLASADTGVDGPPRSNVQQLQSDSQGTNGVFGIVVHGGVNGGVTKPSDPAYCMLDQYTYEQGKELKALLRRAVIEGYRLLQEGDSAELAVVAAISLMEDSQLFDAGKGSFVVRRSDGVQTVEMDAAIMDGELKAVGAVGAVSRVKNPIKAAQVLMRRNRDDVNREVLMFGLEAETYVKTLEPSLEFESFEYFESSWNAIIRTLVQIVP
jgi:L-asparaginase / beta-aspartyl-peptidase